MSCDCRICETAWVTSGGDSGEPTPEPEELNDGAHLPSDNEITIPIRREDLERHIDRMKLS